MPRRSNKQEKVEKLPLSEATNHLLEECRMILPGIQTIFGFQLVAMFSAAFDRKLTPIEQQFHVAALLLMVLAMVLIMTPAAYHRQTRMDEVSAEFVNVASRLLIISLVPFGVSVLIDVYLLLRTVAPTAWSVAFTALVAAALLFFWIALPQLKRVKRAIAGSGTMPAQARRS